MPIRDEEISRLINYAKGLGLKVTFKNKGEDSAVWFTDGSEIIIYKNRQESKIETILSLIHEISHHVWFIHEKNRNPDLKFEEALERQGLFDDKLTSTPAPKSLRKKILATEKAGVAYWDMIYKDTNCKFPLWRLEVAKRFDIWAYEVYYLTGSFPKKKDGRKKFKEITLEIKNK